MPLRAADRALFAAVLAFALLGAAGLGVLLAHGTVPGWLLPAVTAVAIGVAALPRVRPAVAFPTAPAAPRWLLVGTAAVLLVVVVAIAFGALATGSRHWDGVVAWDVKAAFLTEAPTLEQPYFRGDGVYCHSRDYPLLQPLSIALVERATGGGRLVFAFALLIATGAIAFALRRRGASGAWCCLGVLAFALTPHLVNASRGGAYDSGYADAMLCTWVTVAAAGVLAGEGALVALATFLMVVTKPEGLPYAGALVGALWLAGGGRALVGAALGLGGGIALQLPLQRDLNSAGAMAGLVPALLAAAVVAAVPLASDRWLRRRGANVTGENGGLRRRLGAALLLLPLALLALPVLPLLLGDADGSFGSYLRDPSRALARLSRLPEILVGALQHAVLHGSFGLTFVLPPVAALAARGRGLAPAERALALFLLLLLPIWLAPFLLSPIDDLAHHLRSTFPRLFVHGTGAAWLFTTGVLAARTRDPLAAVRGLRAARA